MPVNQMFPPGPCEIAVGFQGYTGAYYFLGTTREGGRAQEILYTGNIPADYSGSDGMPADVRLSGKGIVIACQVQNFNPFTMSALKARYVGGIPGGLAPAEMGTILMQENRALTIMIRSLYANKTSYTNNEPGLRVFTCFVSGEMGWDYSTREQVYNMTFMGLMDIDTDPESPTYLAGFCWDTNVAAFANVVNVKVPLVFDSLNYNPTFTYAPPV